LNLPERGIDLDDSKLRDWLEILGIFGVIASLIFVGFQLKQDREIARAEMFQGRSEMVAQTMSAAAANSEAMAAWTKSAYGDPNQEIHVDGMKSPITVHEMLLGSLQTNAFFALTDNSFFQYKEGFLPEEHWRGVRSEVKNVLLTTPFFRFQAISKLDAMRPDLRQEFLDMLEETEAGTAN
jgi:hypothetical protein